MSMMSGARRQRGISARVLDRGAFLRKVYSLFTLSIMLSGAAAAAACLTGEQVASHGMTVPSGIATALDHPYIMFFSLLGTTLLASVFRYVRGFNVLALGAVAVISGLFIAPMVYMVQLKAHTGTTLTPQPVLHAFILASAAFAGLTGYVLVTGKDFTSWGGFLSMGLWTVIGASILGLFFGGTVFSLALASVSVLLFGGYVLYDTSRLLAKGEDDAVGCALNLYLDFLNLFLNLLRIFAGSSKD